MIMVAVLLFFMLLLASTSSALIHFVPQARVQLPRFRLTVQRTASTLAMSMQQSDTSYPYEPPAWAKNVLKNAPKHGRLHLANLPTPVHLIGSKNPVKGGILSRLNELNIKLYIKRDDATGGTELGGNKVRKLEFLLADALAKGCDSVVTIGGEQR